MKEIFGSENVILNNDSLKVDNAIFPILDDVIILLGKDEYTDYLKARLKKVENNSKGLRTEFAEDIQYSFGEEWQQYSKILPEHEGEFRKYFDIVDIDGLHNLRLCDLGSGNGRWSYFLRKKAQEIILVDFSDSIFVARKNLSDAENCLFFMCDIRKLPFEDNFTDFAFSLGVLHHLPVPCLDEVRKLRNVASKLLIFLYYALDNRPIYFRFILKIITFVRKVVCLVRNRNFRKVFSILVAITVYKPLIYLGRIFKVFGLQRFIPLYEFYHNKTVRRIEQDVYDRFFTRIEQRVTKKQIIELKDTYSKVQISNNLPYYHFICER